MNDAVEPPGTHGIYANRFHHDVQTGCQTPAVASVPFSKTFRAHFFFGIGVTRQEE